MASKFEVEDIYVPHADGVHHDRYRHTSSGWYFVSPSGKVSNKRVPQGLTTVLDWAKQNRLDHEYFVQTVMMNMGTLNMALSGQPIELKKGEPGWTSELEQVRELRTALGEAQRERDAMTAALDVLGIRRCDDDDPPTWMLCSREDQGFDEVQDAAKALNSDITNLDKSRDYARDEWQRAEEQRDAALAQLANVRRVEDWLKKNPVRHIVEYDGMGNFDAVDSLDSHESVAHAASFAKLGAALADAKTETREEM